MGTSLLQDDSPNTHPAIPVVITYGSTPRPLRTPVYVRGNCNEASMRRVAHSVSFRSFRSILCPHRPAPPQSGVGAHARWSARFRGCRGSLREYGGGRGGPPVHVGSRRLLKRRQGAKAQPGLQAATGGRRVEWWVWGPEGRGYIEIPPHSMIIREAQNLTSFRCLLPATSMVLSTCSCLLQHPCYRSQASEWSPSTRATCSGWPPQRRGRCTRATHRWGLTTRVLGVGRRRWRGVLPKGRKTVRAARRSPAAMGGVCFF